MKDSSHANNKVHGMIPSPSSSKRLQALESGLVSRLKTSPCRTRADDTSATEACMLDSEAEMRAAHMQISTAYLLLPWRHRAVHVCSVHEVALSS